METAENEWRTNAHREELKGEWFHVLQRSLRVVPALAVANSNPIIPTQLTARGL